MNPVLLKELRTLLRERRGWLVPMLYATLLAGAVMLFLVPQLFTPGLGPPRFFGQFLVGMVAAVQSVAILVFAPLVGASMVAGERERATWFSLLASPVPRVQVATGKVAAACLYVLVLLSVSAPISALSLLLGAIDLPTLAGLYLTHALVGTALSCAGVAASTLFSRTWTAALVAIGAAFALSVVTGAAGTSVLAAGEAMDADLSAVARGIGCLNPGYGLFLFFAGDTGSTGVADWLGHYAAMVGYTVLSVGFTVARLAGARD